MIDLIINGIYVCKVSSATYDPFRLEIALDIAQECLPVLLMASGFE